MDAQQPESQRLRRDVEWALRRALDPSDVLPLLHRLARAAPEGSEESIFAHRQLAELLVERHPWRAALHARRAVAARPDDERACAVLALCQTMLGNYRFAVAAYHRALLGAPKNPWYAHNLGHLLDVALGRPADALSWLRTAYAGAGQNAEIASSFAHALARAGKVPEAKRVLSRAMKRGASREQLALWKWLEKGAPEEPQSPRPRPSPVVTVGSPVGNGPAESVSRASFDASRPRQRTPRARAARASQSKSTSVPEGGRRRARATDLSPTLESALQASTPQASTLQASTLQASALQASALQASALQASALQASTKSTLRSSRVGQSSRRAPARAIETALLRGIDSLPLDTKQRGRARDLARDLSCRTGAGVDVTALAAAVAYAIVYVDHVPLTQADVAGCFRVSVPNLRGRFKELRALLDLTPGDARYATLRRR